MLAAVWLLLLLARSDGMRISEKDPRPGWKRQMVLPAELIYEMPVPLPGQLAPSPYAQPTTALIGYAAYVSIGQPLYRYLLEVSFESEEIDIWTPHFDSSSVSYQNDSRLSSDTVWFGWRPVRMRVRYSPEAGPSEACPQCSGRLGLARGSSWWLRFPQIHFRANSISLGDIDDSIGGIGTHVASVHCEEDVRDTLCAVRGGLTRIGHDGNWHGNNDTTVRFSLHRPTMVLPSEAYDEFNEDLRNKHALYTHSIGTQKGAAATTHSRKNLRQFFPSIYVKIGSSVTLRMDKDELLAHSDDYHEHLHVALRQTTAKTSASQEIHLSAALLHSFSVTVNSGTNVLTLHAHAVRDHLGYWSLVFVLVLSYLLVRWIVTDSWIHSSSERTVATTPLYKRLDFFSFLYEAAGVVLSLVVLIYTGVARILEDVPTLYGLLGGTMLTAIAMEIAAAVICKTATTTSGENVQRNVSDARVNIVRSSAHKYVLGSALWMAFAARSQDGVDSFISLSISYYVLFVLLYYALWSVQFIIIVHSLPQNGGDDYTRRSEILFLVYLAAVSPALIGIGVFIIYHYLSIPFMRRQLLEYYDISRVLSIIGLVLVVPTAGAVAYIYTRKHIRRALFDQIEDTRKEVTREAVMAAQAPLTRQQQHSSFSLTTTTTTTKEPDESGMRMRNSARC